jgi:thiamine kinase-like enzyme
MIAAPMCSKPNMTDDRLEIERALAAAGIAVPQGDLDLVERLPSLTNRAWRVTAGDLDLVVRLPGPGTQHHIDRRAEARNLRIAAERGVGAPVRYVDEASGVLVMEYRKDATVPDAAQLRRPAAIRRLGRTFRRLHEGPPFEGVMNPFDKIRHYLATAGIADPAGDNGFGGLWTAVEALERRIAFEARDLKPCHVDPVPNNVLDAASGLMLIDWEYAAMSEPLWDLAYAAVEADFGPGHKLALLEAYGLGDDALGELDLWCAVTMAVTVAWCVMQEAVGDDTDTFRAYKASRLAELEAALAAPTLRRYLKNGEGEGRHAVL